MKTLLAIVCTFAIGVPGGVFWERIHNAKQYYHDTIYSIQGITVQMSIQTGLNLTLLQLIEADGCDRVKPLLATQVASFYQTFHDFQPMSEEGHKLMERVEETSDRIPALREALQAAHH